MYDIRYILFDLPGLLRCYVWRNLRRYFPADSGQTSTQRNKKALHITYGISPPDVLASFNLIFQCSRLGLFLFEQCLVPELHLCKRLFTVTC